MNGLKSTDFTEMCRFGKGNHTVKDVPGDEKISVK